MPGDHTTTDTFLQIHQVLKSAIFLTSSLPFYGDETLFRSAGCSYTSTESAMYSQDTFFFCPFHADCGFTLHLRALWWQHWLWRLCVQVHL